MAKKLTREQAAKLRETYLLQRQELLQAKVDDLAIVLFDKVYTQYLSQLEQRDGRLLYNGKNISMVKGLDAIYKNFRDIDNAKVISGFITDAQGVIPLNEKYFGAITTKPTAAAALKATRVVNKGLGLTDKGNKPIKGGFVDLFLRDETLIKKIKKQTTQALTNGKGFQQFRNELKETIQGDGKPLSGGLQQYYRNNAYDTLHKVDRLASDAMAKDLGMRYFFYTGGIISDSRPFCIYCNGKIVDSEEFSKLKYPLLKKKYQPGIPDGKKQTWHPLIDLGGYSCIHRKDYIDTAVAEALRGKWLNLAPLKK